MDQFTREVDEEYRRDQLTKAWKRWGGLVIGAAVALVLGVAGWTIWRNQVEEQARAASLALYEAGRLIDADRPGEARDVLAGLVSQGEAGPAVLARLRLAETTAAGSASEGAAAYDAVAGDASVPAALRDLAQLRAALLRLDSAPDAALPVLQSLAAPTSVYRHTAREHLGLAALRRGDLEAAGRWFDEIVADPQTPPALRQRLEIYVALVAGGPVAVGP